VVTRIDRLAWSIGDLQDIVRTVRARGAVLKATEQPIDTGTDGDLLFDGGRKEALVNARILDTGPADALWTGSPQWQIEGLRRRE
jgi:hypothetical protein